jgi:hypothetical protein
LPSFGSAPAGAAKAEGAVDGERRAAVADANANELLLRVTAAILSLSATGMKYQPLSLLDSAAKAVAAAHCKAGVSEAIVTLRREGTPEHLVETVCDRVVFSPLEKAILHHDRHRYNNFEDIVRMYLEIADYGESRVTPRVNRTWEPKPWFNREFYEDLFALYTNWTNGNIARAGSDTLLGKWGESCRREFMDNEFGVGRFWSLYDEVCCRKELLRGKYEVVIDLHCRFRFPEISGENVWA